MPSCPEVLTILRQIRVRVRFNLSMSSDPYGRHAYDSVKFQFVFEFDAYRKDILQITEDHAPKETVSLPAGRISPESFLTFP